MKRFRLIRKENGAYTVFTAILMTVLVGFLAMSIDVGYHFYRGAKLQNAADAAATAVAANLGTIDNQYEDIAMQYLAKNGFTDEERVHCKVEMKGVTTFDTVDTDDYIEAGYYKLTVWVDDKTFFGNLLDIDSMRLVKTSFVKADAYYVSMPRALNYTVFAGSTKGTPSNPALQINGKTGTVVNTVTSFTQNALNFFNSWVVKPVQAFTLDIGTWWNPTTWKASFNWDNANTWEAKLNTSKLTTSGDVHSNSNMKSKIASINANRIQDTDFEHSISATQLAKFFEMQPIEDVTPVATDYGQVTFDAVKEITFTVPDGYNIASSDHKMDTYYYVQNQQYLEQTQLAMRVVDLINFNDINANGDNFQQLYEDAARVYLIDKVATTAQKEAITNMVANGNLTYEASTKTFNIRNQMNIIYSVNAAQANAALDTAYDDVNGVGIDKMLFGSVEGVDGEYSLGISKVGNDKTFLADGTTPWYYVTNSPTNTVIDRLGEIDENATFVQTNSDGDETERARINILGTVINREYQRIESSGQTLDPSTKAGADFAIARTFIEKSEYIEVPNMKPYFVRQINNSIRNATKTREKLNVASAGQPTIRYAAKERTDTLKSYQDELNYYDDTYRASDSSTLNNLVKSNNPLFKEFKQSATSRVVNLNDSSGVTYNKTTTDGLAYSVSISGKAYKGYNVYNGNNLKTPTEFYNEYLGNRNDSGKKSGANAVKQYYDDTAKAELNSVTTKYNELNNNNDFKYSTKQAAVKTLIDNEGKPDITQGAQSVTPKVTGISLPTASDVFLGDGTSVGSKVTVGTNTLRTSYNSILTSNAFPDDSYFTIPSAGSSPYTSNQGSKGEIKNDGTLNMTNGQYYSSIEAPYYKSWGTKWRKGVSVANSAKVLVTGIFKLDDKNLTSSAPELSVGSSAELYIGGNLEITNDGPGNCTLNSSSKLVVGGTITINQGGTLTVGDNATVYVSGNVDVSNLVLGTNAKLYCKGTLQVARTVSIGSGAVLYSKGNMTFPYQKNYTNKLTNNGKVICDSIISAEDEPITNNSGCLIIAKGGLIASVASDNNSIINSGNIYVSGDINAAGAVYTTGGTIQVLGGIYAANSSGNDILHTNGACSVYVRGVLSTTNGSNKNFWIDSGGAATVSILGVGGSTDVFGGKLNKFFVNCAGSNVYLGGNANINTGSEEFLNSGNLYVYGSLTVPTTSSLTFTNAYRTVIKENLTASNTSGVTVSGGHTLYVIGNISVNNITVTGSGSRVHADGTITAVGALNLYSGGLLEGVGGVSAGSYDTAGGDFNSIKTITFSGDITGNDIPDGYLSGGSVSGTSMTLNNVKLKVEGDLNLNGGALTLTNNTVLYVTGVVRAGAISLDDSKLYADGGIGSSTSIIDANNSLILVKKGNTVASSGYSSIVCSGKVTVSGTSKLYDEGNLTGITSLECSGSSELYGYRAINLNTAYSNANTGCFNISGSNSIVFCGQSSMSDKEVGVIISGQLYYPYNSGYQLKCKYFHIQTNGKLIVDGTEGDLSCLVKSWALIESSGIFCNHGKTKVEACRITNNGMMYMLGGQDVTAADQTDMTGGNQQSAPSYFYFKSGSNTYLGKNYNGNTNLGTLTYTSNYESWGNVYINSNVVVKGYIEDYIQNILGVKTEKGGKDLDGNEGVRVGHLGVSVYIPKGVTYVNGNMTTYADNSKDSAIHIGKYNDNSNDTVSGLVINGDINLASPVANYGKFMVRGEYNLNSTNPQKCTEKNDGSKYKEGKSLVNGRSEGYPSAVFFVGNYKADGTIKNASQYTTFWGDVENKGNIYFNTSTLDVRGYNNEVGTPAGIFAFLNFSGAKAHIGGNVRLNSNQLFNKWKANGSECIFTCDGKLTYGGCIFNCGTVVVGGDITNNETDAETDNSKSYLTNHFSLMNGFYKLDSDVRSNFASKVYPEAELFCGGNMQFGITEQGGESGSVINSGTMYIKGNFDIFTNANSFKFTWDNITEFWNNPQSHSYFRTALWLYDNSNTFIGGNCFAGAGVATGRDSIFMCGGDYRSKRSTKVGIEMFMGTSGLGGITLPGLNDYMSYKENTGTNYTSAYFYVGGNALVNTIGSTVKSFGLVTAPENNSRDMDIYPNTNMYVGGSLYANCKVYMKDNVDLVVAGNKTFYDNSGNILPTIYTSMFSNINNFVPEKNITNGHTVRDHLNNNKSLKFYVYQSFDMMPNSSLIVNGAMQVNDTAKIRDMTKTYVYGSFVGGKYIEIGKALDDADKTAVVSYSGSSEAIAKDGSGNYMYLTDDEIAEIGRIGESNFLNKYVFAKSAYMFVNGDFTSGADVGGTGVLSIFERVSKWFQNTFFSTGYTKVYASSALKVNGNLTSNRYITLRHDAKVYCKGNMEAATSIEGGIYSEWYVGGHMNAATSAVTTILDSIGGLVGLDARGRIEIMDQARIVVGGNMFSSSSIDIGECKAGGYTRGRKTTYTIGEGGTGFYEEGSDFQQALILNYRNSKYYDKSGNEVYLDGSTYKYSNLKDSDNKNIEFGSKDDVIVFVESEGTYHKKTYDGDTVNFSDSDTDDSASARSADGNDGIVTTDEDAYGAEMFVQGSMIALNGHIKEYAYTCGVVGDYVYAPDYITLRSNADLWVLPETFNNETYDFLPYPDKPAERQGFFQRLWDNITYYVGKFAYETTENFKFQTGSVYTFGSLTVNKNASLMGTNNLLQLGAVTHADGSTPSTLEQTLSNILTGVIQRKCVLREDSLVLFGKDIAIASAPVSLSLDFLKGNESYAGFDSKGTATYPGYKYTCPNPNAPEHGGYRYTMTFASQQNSLVCDVCGATIDTNKYKVTQISHPAVMYAGNNLSISTTIDMLSTYLIADQGDVNIMNFYTKTAYDGNNLKELPNAICSYNGDINYTAWVGQLSSLFYAPVGNIDFDGIYTDIYGSVIGNTVQMNAYYQNFHRFNNWRSMDLHIAESGSVYIIPESQWKAAPELGGVYDLTSGSQYKDSPYGVQIFF